jgi:hypothetical protein
LSGALKKNKKTLEKLKKNMKNKYNLIALVAVALTAFAFAASGAALPNSYWYNGDFNGTNGLSSEYNTIVSQANTYDDFNVTSNITVTGVYSNELLTAGFIQNGAEWEIRSGVSGGNAGTLVAGGSIAPATYTANGQDGFGLFGYFVQVSGLNVSLAPGTYYLTVAANDSGAGRAFNSTTSGAGCVGTPCGNNGNSWFNSTFFGTFYGAASDQLGTSPADFSMGVIVPEPATIALVTCGLGALLIAVRRRRS